MTIRKIFVLTMLFIQVLCRNGEDMEGKIVGGEHADIEGFPHSVFLAAFCEVSCDEYWICGSSVLNQRMLLTAGHCLSGCKGPSHYVDALAGHSSLYMVKIRRQIKRYVIHEKYDVHSANCDIALALTDKNLPYGENLRRVWIDSYFPMFSEGTVAGWGIINEEQEESMVLKQVKQTVQTPCTCGRYGSKLKWGMMCASSGFLEDYPSSGDSGSALVLDDFQQIGLVSFRTRLRADLIIYSNVSAFYPWIMDESKILYCATKIKN